MLVIGIKINNMALEKKNGMMEVNIKDFILMLLKKDMENIVGLTEIDMQENGIITCLMEKVYLFGTMIDYIQEALKII